MENIDQQPVSSPQPETQLNQSPKKSWQIAAIIVAGILVLGGVAWGAYYLNKGSVEKSSQSPTPSAFAAPDATAGWQTYQNEYFGFEMKFPKEWYRTKCDVSEGYVSFSDKLIPGDFKCASEAEAFPVTIVSMRYNNDVDYYFSLYVSDPVKYFGLVQPIKTNLVLDGYSAVRIDGYSKKAESEEFEFVPDGTKESVVVFARNGILFELFVHNLNGKDYMEIFSRMLSSFKFIDKTAQQSAPELTKETALALLGKTCKSKGSPQDEYVSCAVDISKSNDYWTVTVTFNGVYDDSVTGDRITTIFTYEQGKWVKGESSKTWSCAPGRGHQDFSTETCF